MGAERQAEQAVRSVHLRRDASTSFNRVPQHTSDIWLRDDSAAFPNDVRMLSQDVSRLVYQQLSPLRSSSPLRIRSIVQGQVRIHRTWGAR